METTQTTKRLHVHQSIIFKNILLFLLIMLVAVVPLAWRYYLDSRNYEIQNLASKLEFFAERGASWVDVAAIPSLTQFEHMQTPAYHTLVDTLQRIEREFDVDNAIIMRRKADGQYAYIAAGASMVNAAQAGGTGIHNPCNPDAVRNPCSPGAVRNPCSPQVVHNPCNVGAIRNPCNPGAIRNPCNAQVVRNPCSPGAIRNPCNPGAIRNPCNPGAIRNPCSPGTVRNPCNAQVVRNPCSPGAIRNPCSPDAIHNPCSPGTVHNPCNVQAVHNPCTPQAVHNPCSPDAVHNPCGPQAVNNPCAPAATAGRNIFDLSMPVHIHPTFPATYKATNDTWLQGEMMHSQLFGGAIVDARLSRPVAYLCYYSMGLNDTGLWQRVCSPPDEQVYNQFLQINSPLKLDGQAVAILMLNKFADPVADAVRAKTLKVIGFAGGVLAIGLVLFGVISGRMLRPLKNLTRAAVAVAQGNLDITVPPPRSQDEVGRLSIAFDGMIEGLRQRDFIRDTFGRYVSKEVAQAVLGSPDGLKMGGEIKEVTFLVSDLRGFSSMAARLSPHEVISIANRYLERMIEIILRYRGIVDEVQGDGILAFFGAPLSAEDDAERAIACAIEMQNALVDINIEQQRLGLPELAMGIGLNIGEVIVGNIGSEERTKYGAMGSPINTAYRIESYTIAGQILTSPALYERVQHLLQVRGTMDVQFKGVDQPVRLHDVQGIGAPYHLTLPDKVADVFTTMTPPFALACYPLEGKAVAHEAIPGAVIALATSSAKVTLDGEVAVHDNLKVTLTPEVGAALDGYAKVLQIEPPGAGATASTVLLEFTSLSEDAKTFLAHKRTDARQEDQRRALIGTPS